MVVRHILSIICWTYLNAGTINSLQITQDFTTYTFQRSNGSIVFVHDGVSIPMPSQYWVEDNSIPPATLKTFQSWVGEVCPDTVSVPPHLAFAFPPQFEVEFNITTKIGKQPKDIVFVNAGSPGWYVLTSHCFVERMLTVYWAAELNDLLEKDMAENYPEVSYCLVRVANSGTDSFCRSSAVAITSLLWSSYLFPAIVKARVILSGNGSISAHHFFLGKKNHGQIVAA